MAIEPVLSHVEQMLDNRIEQFRDKTRLAALLSIYGNQIQAVEDAFAQLLNANVIATSEGAQLDGIGSIVGEPRSGRLDAPYRVAIQTRISLNTSSGTIEDLLRLALAITGGTQAELTEYFPAAFIIRVIDPIPATVEPSRVAAIVTSAKPAGVKATTVLTVAPAFQYDAGSGFDLGKYAIAV